MKNIEVSILDDDAYMLEIVGKLLKANNVDILAFNNPVDFLNHLSSDIIVCAVDQDLKAGLTGLDVLKAIKKKNKSSFVIMLSGYKEPDILIDLINNGIDRYVYKNAENYLRVLVDYILEGLNESKKKRELIKYLEEL